VDEAENGLIGVEKALAVSYDVILMDVQMPVMDGFTAVGMLRNKGVKAPIIALTANAMKGFEEECMAVGYSDYLSKPIDIDRFMELMGHLLDGRRIEAGADSALDSSTVGDREEAPMKAVAGPIVSTLSGSNKAFLGIIRRFVTRLNEQLDAMDKAAAADNFTEMASLAHWLKGAGGTVGFNAFTEPAIRLEQQAKAGDSLQVKDSVSRLRQLAERIHLVDDTDAAAVVIKQKVDAAVGNAVLMPEGQLKPVVSRLSNNPRLQGTIINFIGRLNDKIAEMERAIEMNDAPELASLAHWLKGAGGTVGFDDFTEPAVELEQRAKAGDLATAGVTLKKIRGLSAAIVSPVVKKQETAMTAG
jgi:CheY-like chemotaxis protein